MTLSIRDGVIPPGGYHFPDKSGGTEVRIEGYNVADVAANVLKYRLQNNRPPGNPMQELQEYICGTWPHFCLDSNPPEIPSINGPEPLQRRCAAWLNQWFTSAAADPGVSQQEADRRAKICLQCPKNKDYAAGGCGACTAQVIRLQFIYTRNRKAQGADELGCCDVLSSPLQAAVWSDALPGYSDEQKEQLPTYCWRR